jgi:hypothetical protein
MDGLYEVLNQMLQHCQPQHKPTLTRLVKPLWEQLDHNIAAAKQVERGLQQRRAAAAAAAAAAVVAGSGPAAAAAAAAADGGGAGS